MEAQLLLHSESALFCVIEEQCCDIRRAGVNGSRLSSPLWTSSSHMCRYRYYSSHKTTRPHLKVVSCRNTLVASKLGAGAAVGAEFLSDWEQLGMGLCQLDTLAPSKATSRCGSTARIKCLNHYLSRGILGLMPSHV